MKSKILKFVILASSLAFFNCDDSVNSAVDQAQAAVDGQTIPTNPNDLSSSGMADPVIGGGEGGDTFVMSSNSTDFGGGQGGEGQIASSADATFPASSGAVVPTSSDAVMPTSSDAVIPASSDAVNPPASSSSKVKPTSSSEEAQPESSSSEEVKPAGIFLAEGKEEEKDQMQIVYTENIEPCMFKDGKNLCKILAYPKQLSETQKHAVVVWGPGGGSDPKDYRAIISRLASHGFVVVALRESPGNANEGIEALNWLDKKNKDPNDPLYNKLDMNTVGASGHSMGGLESEQMVIKDKRVLTAFLNNSGDWNGAGANKVATDRSIAILFGEVGMEKDNAKNDYNNAGVKAPACLIEMTGGPRNSEGGYGHGSGSWDGMAATVAWMRWHLGGEDFRKADFVGSTGKYIDGNIIGKQGKWKGQCKNF